MNKIVKNNIKYKNLAMIALFFILFSTSYSINVWSQPEPTIPAVGGCQIQLDKQPADAVEMNSAVVKATVKTIHVEKEVFICETERGPPLIMDIGIYTEIIEDLRTQRVLNNTFEVTTCAKTFDGTILGCISKEPPTTLPTLDCHLQRQLELPTPSIEMNTVVSSDGVVPLIKTIEAHKEVFECTTDLYPTIKDVIIFTEMFENLDEMVTLKKSFISATCIKNTFNATVLACSAQQIG